MVPYYFLRCSGLILLGLLIYGQTFHFGFVFDDYLFVVTNPFIKNFSNFPLMWHDFPMTRLVGMFSFAVNYYFNQFHPWGYHVFNFIIHLISTGLVWAVSGLLFKAAKILPSKDRVTRDLPFIIAAIFLVHPCQTQAVTYITQRFESMATMFYLGTIYMYLRARLSSERKHKTVFFVLAALLTILGIMTKEVAITIPAMIFVFEWILFPQKKNIRLYLYLIMGAGFLYLLFTKLVHANLGVLTSTFISESHDGDILTPARYFLTQMRVFLTFLRLLVLPVHQNLEYDYPASVDLFHPPLTLVGLCVIACIIWLTCKWRRKFPLISLGMAWILITFSINMVPRANVIFEHKLYLLSFGFILATVMSLSVLVKNRRTLMKVLGCLVAVLTLLSFQRNKVWANELSLWEDCIKKSPHKARVNASLGRAYGSLGRYEESIKYLSRSIAIHPDNITYENRGIIYSLEGRMPQALEDLNKSIAMDPGYYITYAKRAWVYFELHDSDAAMADLAHAIRLDPYYSDAYLERGTVWMALGRNQDALNDFNQVLKIDPFNAQALQYRRNCLTKEGR